MFIFDSDSAGRKKDSFKTASRPTTPVLRYSEEPDSSDDRSGSSEYLRAGVRVTEPILTGIR